MFLYFATSACQKRIRWYQLSTVEFLQNFKNFSHVSVECVPSAQACLYLCHLRAEHLHGHDRPTSFTDLGGGLDRQNLILYKHVCTYWYSFWSVRWSQQSNFAQFCTNFAQWTRAIFLFYTQIGWRCTIQRESNAPSSTALIWLLSRY